MKVFNKLDINPTNMNLYMEAVTHSSFTNENPSYPDYERLEFLGDAVLEIIISEYLYKERNNRYPYYRIYACGLSDYG